MQSPAKTVNMFGPIGGTDYLKLTMANKFKSKLRGNPMLTALGANPIPGKPLPQQVSKNAVQMYLQSRRDGGQASVFATGRGTVPVGSSDRELLKAAAEKLLSDRTFDNEYFDKTALGPLALLPAVASAGSLALRAAPAAWRIGKGAYGLLRGGAGALWRGGTGAGTAFRNADTVGGAVSNAASAASTAARAGAKAYSPASAEAYRTLGRVGEEAGKLKATGVGGRLMGGLQGAGLGYGVDAGAGMMGIDTGGLGSTLGGAGGLIGAGPLRSLRRGLLGRRGAARYPASWGTPQYTLGQKLVNTGDNIANRVTEFGKNHAGKLHTAAGLGGIGMVQSATTGGLYDMTDLQGNIERAQEFGRDNIARGFGYEGGYGEMTQDVSPIIEDIRRTLQENQMRSGYAQR